MLLPNSFDYCHIESDNRLWFEESRHIETTKNLKGITEEEIADPRSFGLMGINERVNSLGGSVAISGSKNTGTTVRVSIPTGSSEDSTRAEDTSGR